MKPEPSTDRPAPPSERERAKCIGPFEGPCPDGETTLNESGRCRNCDLEWYQDPRRT